MYLLQLNQNIYVQSTISSPAAKQEVASTSASAVASKCLLASEFSCKFGFNVLRKLKPTLQGPSHVSRVNVVAHFGRSAATAEVMAMLGRFCR